MTENIRDLVEPEPKVKTSFSLLALLSFITGILAYLIYLLPLLTDLKFIIAVIISPICAITAILSGHNAKRKMSNKEALVKGKKLANTGLMLGYIYFALAILTLALVLTGAVGLANLLGKIF